MKLVCYETRMGYETLMLTDATLSVAILCCAICFVAVSGG